MSNLPINWFPSAAVRKPAAQTIDEGYTRGTPIEPEEYQYIIRNLSSALIALTGEAQGAERQVVIPAGGLAWRQNEPLRSIRIAAKIANSANKVSDIRTWASAGVADTPGSPLDPDQISVWQGEAPWTSVFASTQLPRATFGGTLTEARLIGGSSGRFSDSIGENSFVELALVDSEGTEIRGRIETVEAVPGEPTISDYVFRFTTGPDDGEPIAGDLVGHIDVYLRMQLFGMTPTNDESLLLRFSGLRLTFAAEEST